MDASPTTDIACKVERLPIHQVSASDQVAFAEVRISSWQIALSAFTGDFLDVFSSTPWGTERLNRSVNKVTEACMMIFFTHLLNSLWGFPLLLPNLLFGLLLGLNFPLVLLLVVCTVSSPISLQGRQLFLHPRHLSLS